MAAETAFLTTRSARIPAGCAPADRQGASDELDGFVALGTRASLRRRPLGGCDMAFHIRVLEEDLAEARLALSSSGLGESYDEPDLQPGHSTPWIPLGTLLMSGVVP